MDIKGYYGNAAYGIGQRTAVGKGKTPASAAKFADFLTAAASGTSGTSAKQISAGNTDRLEVDYDALFEQVKARIASAVDADTNLQRIEQLQSGYAGGSVPVSAGAVVSAIL